MVYDGLLGLEGLILVGDMTADGAVRGSWKMFFHGDVAPTEEV